MDSVTVANIFTEAAATMTGLMSMTTGFFEGLWGNPMGKIVITLGLVSAGVGLCKSIYLRRKRV